MKITELSFQNFRTFNDPENLTSIAKNNYLIGPNGTGKSNIFSGIQLLKGIFLGSYTLKTNDYFDCNNTAKLVVSVTLELTEYERDRIIPSIPKLDDEPDLLDTHILKHVRYEVTFRKSAIVNEIFSIRNHSNNFETQIRPVDTNEYRLESFDLTEILKLLQSNPSSKKLPLSHTTHTSSNIRDSVRALNSTLYDQIICFFENIHYVSYQRQSKNQIQASMAEDIEPTGANLLNELDTVNNNSRPKYSDYEKSVKDATRTITSVYQSMVSTQRVLQIEEDGLQNRIDHANISSGYHQMLILVHIIKNMNASVILLEEPELHLHARAQKAILDLIRKNNSSTQFFIETHSPVFVGASDSEATFLLLKNDGASSITPIYGDILKQIKYELGLRHSDVFDHDFLCIVEGKSEQIAFLIFAQRLGYSIGYEFSLLNLDGCGNLKYVKMLLRYLQTSDKRIFLLLDEDKNAQIKTDQLIEEKLLDPNFTHKLDKSFEDQFSDAQLIKAMCEISTGMNFKFCLTEQELSDKRIDREAANIFDEHLHQPNQSKISYKTQLAEKLAKSLSDDEIKQNKFVQIVEKILMKCNTPRLDSL